jgi:putative FmdB family regulatory protein
MPTYTYEPATDRCCRYCLGGFDRRQKVNDARLTTCPECGEPVKRVISAPTLARPAPSIDEKNIGDKGFTQYKKLEKGVYEKTVGKGPDIIMDKDD